MQKNLAKEMQFLERIRKQYILGIKISLIVFPLLTIFCFIYMFINELYSYIFFISFLCTFIIPSSLYFSYKNKVKKAVFKKLLSFIGNFEYIDNTRYIIQDKQYLKSLTLFGNFADYTREDRFKGIYNDLPVDIMDIRLENPISEDNVKTKGQFFQGVFIKVPSMKNFRHKTIIRYKYDIFLPLYDNYEKVKLEDPEFEKSYDTFSTDQVEARYIITTAFMNRLVELAKNNNYKISISFEQRNINIALSCLRKNWFEVPISKPATDINNYIGVLQDLQAVLSIIDTLKLDSNIGM